jgi:hypothetical protein
MNKQLIIVQLVNLLDANHIDSMEAKTTLRNTKSVTWLTVAEIAFALFEYARDEKLTKQQIENCNIVISILEAMAEKD